MYDNALRRVTDLFTEGIEVHCGDDDNGPTLVWVNKLNSFEVEEARRDGVAHRGLRLSQLSSLENPEYRGLRAEVALWSEQRLREAWAGQKAEEVYIEVLDDLRSDPDWRERIERMERLPQLLDDADAPDDDPRRVELANEHEAYLEQIVERQTAKRSDLLKDAEQTSREDLEEAFFEAWRQRLTVDTFVEERRVTELFLAMRPCKGRECGKNDAGETLWDHEECDHSARLLSDRKLVRGLPDALLEIIVDALNRVTIPQRTAGNSDAPASSSESSGRSSDPEDQSTPSSPAVMPPDAPTT